MTPTPEPTTPTDVLTVEEVAEFLRIHPDTVYRKVETNEIPGAFRIGEGEKAPIRFSKQVFLDWIHQQPRP